MAESLTSDTVDFNPATQAKLNFDPKNGGGYRLVVPSTEHLEGLQGFGCQRMLQRMQLPLHATILKPSSATVDGNQVTVEYRVNARVVLTGEQIPKLIRLIETRAHLALEAMEGLQSAHEHDLLHGRLNLQHLAVYQLPGEPMQLRIIGIGQPLVAYTQLGHLAPSKIRDVQDLAVVLAQLLLGDNGHFPDGLRAETGRALEQMRSNDRPVQVRGMKALGKILRNLARRALPQVGLVFPHKLNRFGIPFQEVQDQLLGEKKAMISRRPAYDEESFESIEVFTDTLHFRFVRGSINPDELVCVLIRREEPLRSMEKRLVNVEFQLNPQADGAALWEMLRLQQTGQTVDLRSQMEAWPGFHRSQQVLDSEREHYNRELRIQVRGALRLTQADLAELKVDALQRPVDGKEVDVTGWLGQHDLEGYTLKIGRERIGVVHSVHDDVITLRVTNRDCPTGDIDGELYDTGFEVSLERGEQALKDLKLGRSLNPQIPHLLLNPALAEDPRGGPVNHLFQHMVPETEVKAQVGRVVNGKPALYVVQGPPGTGKTTFIKEVILQLIQQDPECRILVTSQSRPAVSNVTDGLHDLMEKGVVEPFLLHRDDRAKRTSDEFDRWAQDTRERSEAQGGEAFAEWRRELGSRDVEDTFLQNARVIGCTLMRLPQILRRLGEDQYFDWVIIDEAARANLHELAMAMLRGKHVVLVGDHKQLPPHLETRTHEHLRELGFSDTQIKRTVFQELYDGIPEEDRSPLPEGLKHTLTVQYRMHESIARVVSTAYYQGKVTTGELQDRSLPLPGLGESRARWANVEGLPYKQGTSWVNDEQARAARQLLINMDRMLHEHCRATGEELKYTVAVICTYLSQKRLLTRLLGSLKLQHLSLERGAVNTVDAFQGQERDIVLHVGSRPFTHSRFAADPQRLNVAFSRAKRLLVVIGHHYASLRLPELAPTREMFELIPDAYLEVPDVAANTPHPAKPDPEGSVPHRAPQDRSDHLPEAQHPEQKRPNRRKLRNNKRKGPAGGHGHLAAGADPAGDPEPAE